MEDKNISLRAFTLKELEQFTKQGQYDISWSGKWYLYFVGVDNVHEILKYLFSRATTSIYLNMFGYDDDELNEIIMQKIMDPTVTVIITLDKSQSGGVHEKKLLDADKKQNLSGFNTHFVIGESATHQISHTKGFVIDGIVGGEGSTNWSASGEGTFVVKGMKAQNNTQTVFTDTDAIARFTAELINEHLIAQKQSK